MKNEDSEVTDSALSAHFIPSILFGWLCRFLKDKITYHTMKGENESYEDLVESTTSLDVNARYAC